MKKYKGFAIGDEVQFSKDCGLDLRAQGVGTVVRFAKEFKAVVVDIGYELVMVHPENLLHKED